MNTLEKIFKKNMSGSSYCKEYTKLLSELLANLDFQEVNQVIEILLTARKNKKKIFFIGNGGSAATCSHFAEDLGFGTIVPGKKPFRTLSLTDNVAYITALANDEGYENIFTGQLKNLFTPGDIVIGISASGNSKNVIKALEYANKNGGVSVGLIGFDGGEMKDICKYTIHVKTTKGEYGPVEDIHLIIDHIISSYLLFKLKEEKSDGV
jgi:D-sedoheptulose 7-phosphate isomerase